MLGMSGRYQVTKEVRNQVTKEVRNQVTTTVRYQVTKKVRNQVTNTVRYQGTKTVRYQVTKENLLPFPLHRLPFPIEFLCSYNRCIPADCFMNRFHVCCQCIAQEHFSQPLPHQLKFCSLYLCTQKGSNSSNSSNFDPGLEKFELFEHCSKKYCRTSNISKNFRWQL